jgi:formylmethanofuran dehydrogenase subunit E
MGLAGGSALGIAIPRNDKRLLVITETDGCFTDGVAVATGCTVGHRSMRVEDYGKIAATFILTRKGRAVRLAPKPNIRVNAHSYAPTRNRDYFAQLEGYQRMPVEELFSIQEVQLTTPVQTIISRAGIRVNCDQCGEEIINEREVKIDGSILCRGCTGPAYYQLAERSQPLEDLLAALRR